MPKVVFLWDHRPGGNVDHIATHGMLPQEWEVVYHHAEVRLADKDDETVMVAEGRAYGRLFRIIYGLDEGTIIPITVIPITGFPITRRGLRRRTP
jgi:hypothetical protein